MAMFNLILHAHDFYGQADQMVQYGTSNLHL
jgi:hypothetical protein